MKDDISFSFEFFPPRTEAGNEKLKQVRSRLNLLGPKYFSVTYGAGGTTRDNTRDTVLEMNTEGLEVAPHLSFGANDEAFIENLLNIYKDAGIHRLVALRGDLPPELSDRRLIYANELVEFVRARFGDHFEIAVGCYPEVHPQASGYAEDVRYLKQKLDAGSDYAVTQYFYNADAYARFLDECEYQGIDKPIIPGIMPITNLENLSRFSSMCGAEIPRWLLRSLADFEPGSEDFLRFGEEVVTNLCEQLIELGAESFHFYTMNQYEPTANICANLGLLDQV
ncbi:MAG: methylenetetrahydrofolate reductase [NAD(P)H] [Pseudohongiellaceae bacterium]